VCFVEYLSNGAFPRITVSTGLASIKEVAERTRYPISKSLLIKKLGWRLVEVKEGKQVKLETFLADLPSKTLRNVEELIDDIQSAGKINA
jgi:hypothetical protein